MLAELSSFKKGSYGCGGGRRKERKKRMKTWQKYKANCEELYEVKEV
jgi:hypothetical protein